MADVTLTASSVTSSNLAALTGLAGATIAAGDFLYADAADGSRLKLANAFGAVAEADVVGVALANGVAGQVIPYVSAAIITAQAGVFGNSGLPLFLSASTPGKCATGAPVGQGDYLTFIGYSTATNKFQLFIKATGFALL